MQEVFETYYVKDWGTADAAKAARAIRRNAVMRAGTTIVRGTVQHRVHGLGYDLWYRIPNKDEDTREFRIMRDGYEPQTSPKLIVTEEKWTEH